jgi:hypothetical protein
LFSHSWLLPWAKMHTEHCAMTSFPSSTLRRCFSKSRITALDVDSKNAGGSSLPSWTAYWRDCSNETPFLNPLPNQRLEPTRVVAFGYFIRHLPGGSGAAFGDTAKAFDRTMKPDSYSCRAGFWMRLGLALAFCNVASQEIHACTIFILTDTNRVLFCNNEDWSNPKTRIWFVPAGAGYYGCVYVGYDDGWARGGLNTEGLACDWVGGFMEHWEAGPREQCVRGNPTERMLESCAAVSDAIAFCRQHPESDFARAKIFVADKNGASAVIGARDGRLVVEQTSRSRGFGFGEVIADKMLANSSVPSVANGAAILRACVQRGQYATKYSNVFDLKSGDIWLFPLGERKSEATFNLAVELAKGGHYYDMPGIREQLAQAALQPLLTNMKRFFLDAFPPIPDTEPKITAHLRATVEDARRGVMRSGDYTAEYWKAIAPLQKELQADFKRYGDLISMALVERRKEERGRSYRYRVEFEKVTLLLRYVLSDQDQIALLQSEGAERKPGADLGGD